MFTNSYMGVQVWLITSKHTDPELKFKNLLRVITVRVEYFIQESNRRAFVRVLFRQIKVDGPFALLVRSLFGAYACMKGYL